MTPPALDASAQAAQQLACLLAARYRPAALAEAGGWDWPALASLARHEGVAGQALAVIERQGLEPGPAAWETLRAERYQAVAESRLQAAEMRRALRALTDAGLETMLLKGAALRHSLFPEPGQRRMGDIDLLVRRADAPTAIGALAGIGYQAVQAELRPGSRLRFENEVQLEHAGPPRTLLELHWHLIDSPFYQRRIDMSWFWERSRPADLEGLAARLPDAEGMLLHLAAHLGLHHPESNRPRLRWQQDIAALLWTSGARLDWALVLAQAEAWALSEPLAAVLEAVAGPPWHGPLPETARRRLARPAAGASRGRAEPAHALTPARRLWRDLRDMASWRDRLAFVLINLLPSPAYMRQRYGGRAPLAQLYLGRWLRGVKQALGRTLL